jgi:hypothetical protein
MDSIIVLQGGLVTPEEAKRLDIGVGIPLDARDEPNSPHRQQPY